MQGPTYCCHISGFPHSTLLRIVDSHFPQSPEVRKIAFICSGHRHPEYFRHTALKGEDVLLGLPWSWTFAALTSSSTQISACFLSLAKALTIKSLGAQLISQCSFSGREGKVVWAVFFKWVFAW